MWFLIVCATLVGAGFMGLAFAFILEARSFAKMQDSYCEMARSYNQATNAFFSMTAAFDNQADSYEHLSRAILIALGEGKHASVYPPTEATEDDEVPPLLYRGIHAELSGEFPPSYVRGYVHEPFCMCLQCRKNRKAMV